MPHYPLTAEQAKDLYPEFYAEICYMWIDRKIKPTSKVQSRDPSLLKWSIKTCVLTPACSISQIIEAKAQEAQSSLEELVADELSRTTCTLAANHRTWNGMRQIEVPDFLKNDMRERHRKMIEDREAFELLSPTEQENKINELLVQLPDLMRIQF